MRHDNITEAEALGAFIYSHFASLIWADKFGTSFTNLVSMYEQNELGMPVQEILIKHEFAKLKVRQPEKKELRDKFREILKWCFLNHHAEAIKVKRGLEMLSKTLDNIWYNLREEIIDEVSYDPNK
jgi:hypothetical protein